MRQGFGSAYSSDYSAVDRIGSRQKNPTAVLLLHVVARRVRQLARPTYREPISLVRLVAIPLVGAACRVVQRVTRQPLAITMTSPRRSTVSRSTGFCNEHRSTRLPVVGPAVAAGIWYAVARRLMLQSQ